MQRTIDVALKHRLKATINAMQRQISNSVVCDRNDSWNKKLCTISKGNKKLWTLSKEFKGKTDSNANKIRIAGSLSTNDSDRANMLADIFEKAHATTASFSHENDRTVMQSVNAFNTFSNMSCEVPHSTFRTVSDIVKSLKPFKSPGLDTIQNILLKNIPPIATVWLTNFFNKCLVFSFWPKSFKIAKIIPILKSDYLIVTGQSAYLMPLAKSLKKLSTRNL